jgi:quercetin dioxygenase-like cupin family protein
MKLAPRPQSEQPFGIEIASADGIFVKQMAIPKSGSWVPQHAHRYDHITMLARGAVQVWVDGIFQRVYRAPCAITISAGVKHSFLTLDDFTILYCIHRIDRTGSVEIDQQSCIGECEKCLLPG